MAEKLDNYIIKYKDNLLDASKAEIKIDLTDIDSASELNDINLVNKSTGSTVSHNNGFFIQNAEFVDRGEATRNVAVTNGFTFPDDMELPTVKVGSYNSDVDISGVQTIFKPAFFDVNSNVYRTYCNTAYKLLEGSASDSTFEDTSLGTDTMKCYILLMIDNTSGTYDNSAYWTTTVRPYLQTGEVNFIKISSTDASNKTDGSLPGYRGVSGVTYPQTTEGDEEATQYNNTIGAMEFRFGETLDVVVPAFEEREGQLPNGKYYKLSILPFGYTQFVDTENEHEDVISTGVGLKGVIGVYQVADTEADKNDYIQIRILKSDEEFTSIESDSNSENVLDTTVGYYLVSTANVYYTTSGRRSDDADADLIHSSGASVPLSYFYDMTLGSLASAMGENGIITKFQAEQDWDEQAYTTIGNDTDDNKVTYAHPIICKPRINYSATVTELLGDEVNNVSSDISKDISFDNAKECLAFSLSDLQTALSDAGSWSSDQIAEILELPKTLSYLGLDENSQEYRDALEYKRDYDTGYYSYNNLIEAIKYYYINNGGDETTWNDTVSLTYESAFKVIWGEDVYKTPFGLKLIKCGYYEGEITISALGSKSPINEPYYLAFQKPETLTLSTNKITTNVEGISDLSVAKEHVADIGNVVFNGSVYTDETALADLEYAKVWKDIEGQDSLKSDLIPDLNELETIEDEIYPNGAPYIDNNVDSDLLSVALGRLQKKTLEVGAWHFFYLTSRVWRCDGFRISRVYWKPGYNFDAFCAYEESYNPDFDCTTVSFCVKEGVIDPSYWEQDNYVRLYASVYFCAEAENGEVTEQEYSFEIVKPVVLGVLTRTHKASGVSNNLWAYQSYSPSTYGMYWYKRYINKSYSELEDLDLIDHQQSHFYRMGLGVATPRYLVYKGNESIRYEFPIIYFPYAGVIYPNRTNTTYQTFDVTDTNGYTHSLKVPETPVTYSDNAFPQDYTGTQYSSYSTSTNYKELVIGAGNISSPEAGTVEVPYLLDRTKATYTRQRFKVASGSDKYSTYTKLGFFSPIMYAPGNSTVASRFAYDTGYYTSNTAYNWNTTTASEITSDSDILDLDNNYLHQDVWYWTETIWIPIKDTDTTVAITRIQRQGDDWTEADLRDNSKWKVLCCYPVACNKQDEQAFITSQSFLIHDVSSAKSYVLKNTDSLNSITLTDLDATVLVENKKSLWEDWFNHFYAYENDSETYKDNVECYWDINNSDHLARNLQSEFILYDDNGSKFGRNYMIPTLDFTANLGANVTNHSYSDARWYYSSHTLNTSLGYYSYVDNLHNNVTQNQVEGFQEIDNQAIIYDADSKLYYLPRSQFTKWLNDAQGLPYASDYMRMVLQRRIKDITDLDDEEDCWGFTDSLNYKLNVPSSLNEAPTLTRVTDGREWNSRNDFMYDVFHFIPRCHIMVIEFVTTDVTNNFQCRYRFEATSMSEFIIHPEDLIKKLRGDDSTEVVSEIRAFELDVTEFWNNTTGNFLPNSLDEFIIGSAKLPSGKFRVTLSTGSVTSTGNSGAGVVGYYSTGSNSEVRSVLHRAFTTLRVKDGWGFSRRVTKNYDNWTSEDGVIDKNLVYQSTEGSRMEIAPVAGYWVSSYPVQGRRIDSYGDYDSQSNFDADAYIPNNNIGMNTSYTQIGISNGSFSGASISTEAQTSQTFQDGIAEDGSIPELCVTGGAPSNYQAGRQPYTLHMRNDYHADTFEAGICNRYFRGQADISNTVIGSIGVENAQLYDLMSSLMNIEKMGWIATAAIGHHLVSGSAGSFGRFPGGEYKGWVFNTHTIYTSSTARPSSTSWMSNAGSVAIGVGSAEYGRNYAINNYPNGFGSVRHLSAPIIDYRYSNYTRDSYSTACGVLSSAYTGRKSATYLDTYEGNRASLYRGWEFLNIANMGYVGSTERILAYNSLVKTYAPYGYEFWNLESKSSSSSENDDYGYNPINNPRIACALNDISLVGTSGRHIQLMSYGSIPGNASGLISHIAGVYVDWVSSYSTLIEYNMRENKGTSMWPYFMGAISGASITPTYPITNNNPVSKTLTHGTWGGFNAYDLMGQTNLGSVIRTVASHILSPSSFRLNFTTPHPSMSFSFKTEVNEDHLNILSPIRSGAFTDFITSDDGSLVSSLTLQYGGSYSTQLSVADGYSLEVSNDDTKAISVSYSNNTLTIINNLTRYQLGDTISTVTLKVVKDDEVVYTHTITASCFGATPPTTSSISYGSSASYTIYAGTGYTLTASSASTSYATVSYSSNTLKITNPITRYQLGPTETAITLTATRSGYTTYTHTITASCFGRTAGLSWSSRTSGGSTTFTIYAGTGYSLSVSSSSPLGSSCSGTVGGAYTITLKNNVGWYELTTYNRTATVTGTRSGYTTYTLSISCSIG